MGKRIVIMAGGTGGHVFPALAVAQLLMEKGWQVSWLGTHKGLESKVVPENSIDIDWLSVAGVRGKGVVSKVKAVILLLRACGQAVCILRRRKPDIVLGMGGFVAGPGGLMAKLLGIPLIIHEQNRVPGTTNRLLAKLANQVLEAFPGSFNKKVGAKCTGNPLRKAFLIASDRENRREKTAVNVLIFGGSQGAQILNEVVPEAVVNLAEIQVIHQTGVAMFEQVKGRYRELNVKAHVTAFIDDMVAAYQWADIVVCRSGAMTVSEIAAMGVPAIFIPLPNAIDDHQVANARYLTDAGAGLLLMQKDLTPMSLAEKITQALGQLDAMRKAAIQCARLEATEEVAEFCIAGAKS
ncbi:N-acetylglucosaminyl transferase [Crenothrix polyspora]|uniref:UDP-N-acetylglucosamine--N-acetylmuramyl-(pentapeptide) pyrophosphoryl-undecaprenol N-acetylglucosamine transferase n=1 Tax=Crenothrix polyspora TaxID=360316 RepID=A0A1R4HBZ8_9GAMM|nr:undecaprenyldiphospho-muramoylpentapeptide beta-N-acetylglucosaminyltransferase [Crenothrix polyspora]SJM93778.1 N-acetylglucosaminyl transferase [Crenothrix polyspora]